VAFPTGLAAIITHFDQGQKEKAKSCDQLTKPGLRLMNLYFAVGSTVQRAQEDTGSLKTLLFPL
jgi:hypothetical protein